MKITPWKKKALKLITENLSAMPVTVNMLNPSMRTGTQHFYREAVFGVLEGKEFCIYSDVACPLNLVRICIDMIREIKEHNLFNYSIIMEDDTTIRISRYF